MEVTIKQASVDDITDLAKLFNSYRVFFSQCSDLSLAHAFISDRLKNADSVIFCAYLSDDKCVGFAQLYPSFSSVSAKQIWILNDLFINEAHRGMGIGKKLLNEIKLFGKKSNAKGVLIETTVSNTAAQSLYEANSFQRVPERIFYEWNN